MFDEEFERVYNEVYPHTLQYKLDEAAGYYDSYYNFSEDFNYSSSIEKDGIDELTNLLSFMESETKLN